MYNALRLIFRQTKRFPRRTKMAQSKDLSDAVKCITDKQSYSSISTAPEIKYRPMPDPLSVYVPLDSLTEETINSIVSTVHQCDKKRLNHSIRTLLAFLLAINKKLSEIEKTKGLSNKFDEKIVQHATKVRQWLVQKDHSGNIKDLDWDELHAHYNAMASEKNDGIAKYFGIDKFEPYYELTIQGVSLSNYIAHAKFLIYYFN